jgi:hypothetical protein
MIPTKQTANRIDLTVIAPPSSDVVEELAKAPGIHTSDPCVGCSDASIGRFAVSME